MNLDNDMNAQVHGNFYSYLEHDPTIQGVLRDTYF